MKRKLCSVFKLLITLNLLQLYLFMLLLIGLFITDCLLVFNTVIFAIYISQIFAVVFF